MFLTQSKAKPILIQFGTQIDYDLDWDLSYFLSRYNTSEAAVRH